MIELIGGKLKLYGDVEQGKLFFKVDGEFVEVSAGAVGVAKAPTDSKVVSGNDGELVVCDGSGGLKSSGLTVVNESVDINTQMDNCLLSYNSLRMLIRPIIKMLKKGE